MNNLMQQLLSAPALPKRYRIAAIKEHPLPGQVLIIDYDKQPGLSASLARCFNTQQAKLSDDLAEQALVLQASVILVLAASPGARETHTIKHLKATSATSHIPIIALVHQLTDREHIQWLDVGVDRVFAASVDARVLKASANALLNERERLRQIYQSKPMTVLGLGTDSSFNQVFVKRARSVVLSHYGNPAFNIEQLVKHMKVSRTMLYVKIKQMTGKTTSEFVRDIRLEEAARLLKEGVLNVSEVAFKVGFKDPKYLSKKFKVRYGITPSDFRRG